MTRMKLFLVPLLWSYLRFRKSFCTCCPSPARHGNLCGKWKTRSILEVGEPVAGARLSGRLGNHNDLRATRTLGAGDFSIKVRLALRRFESSAASFFLNQDHFGFDGRGKKFFARRLKRANRETIGSTSRCPNGRWGRRPGCAWSATSPSLTFRWRRLSTAPGSTRPTLSRARRSTILMIACLENANSARAWNCPSGLLRRNEHDSTYHGSGHWVGRARMGRLQPCGDLTQGSFLDGNTIDADLAARGLG